MKPNFQLIVIIVFITLAIVGVLVFSGAIPLGEDNSELGQGTVVLWGTVRGDLIAGMLEDFNTANPTYLVQYVQKNKDTFDRDLLEALATGTGPDMFFLPDDLAYHYSNKIFPIPYSSFSEASFKGAFASAGEVFLTGSGILALPLTIDPMVMYYNRTMLDASGVVYPPNTWTDLIEVTPKLTQKDEANQISKSAVALGHFSNVNHAKDILVTLFMQSGNPIVAEQGGTFVSKLYDIGRDLGPFLKFYTDFADPTNGVYSWNKSFPSSVDAFSREELAFYFGYGSELPDLVNRNPNQNFLMAPMPQVKDSNLRATKANVMGIAISRFSRNLNTTFIAANAMATSNFASILAGVLNTAPARRDLLSVKQTDSYKPILYSSALYSRSWLDPKESDTDTIFRGMIDSVLANNSSPSDAVKDASSKLGLMLTR